MKENSNEVFDPKKPFPEIPLLVPISNIICDRCAFRVYLGMTGKKAFLGDF
jgi:hypothetical protein